MTWITSFSDRIFTKLLSDDAFMRSLKTKLSQELHEYRTHAMECLGKLVVPFAIANAGLFLYIDLSEWVALFRTGAPGEDDVPAELKMCRYLMQKGIFLQPDAVCHSWRLLIHLQTAKRYM